MRCALLVGCFFLVDHVVGQAIVPNAWLCDWMGVEGAKQELKNKYRILISNLNKDKTLKDQQARVTNWIQLHAADLPEIQKRVLMTKSNKVMIPNLMVPKLAPDAPVNAAKAMSAMSMSVAAPVPVDKQVIDNTIYNAKYWLAMRARDVSLINDILRKIQPEMSAEKYSEIEKLIWSQDKKLHNFYRPHYDVIKQMVLGKITSAARREIVRELMEEAEAVDDETEPEGAIMPLMEPMASEFFPGCGL